MATKKISISMLIIISLSMCQGCFAGSIWAKRDRNMRELYTDDVARSIGDIITIKIVEASKIDNKAKRDMSKTTDRSIDFNGKLGIKHFPDLPGVKMSAESSNEFKGKADYKDDRKFTDLISVVVIDVMPNKNLVVMGTRTRKIAGDIQIIEVSGIVRPSDINYGNTVDSNKVADFQIMTKVSGYGAPYNKPGWLGGIMDRVWFF